jgi:hypothetical protein
MNAIALIVVLMFAGVRVPARQVACAGLLTVLVILSISGIRVQTGRGIYYTNSGVTARVGALATGLSSAGGSSGAADSPGLVAQFAARVSAVDYGGAILQAISEGQPRLSPGYVPQSLLLTVPSFLWPAKLSQGAALNPAQLQIADFGLQPINFIPGAPGLYLGILTPAWLVTLFALLGAVFGWFERWLLRVRTPARMVLLAGAVEAALHFEGGLPTMLVQMRSAAVLALAVYAVTVLRVPGARAGSHSPVMPHPDAADVSAATGGCAPRGRGQR